MDTTSFTQSLSNLEHNFCGCLHCGLAKHLHREEGACPEGAARVLTVDTLADILQEPNRPLLAAVVRTLGQQRTEALLTATVLCETQGGMRTKAGDRRRTPGGVFFQLVRQQTTGRERRELFPPQPSIHTAAGAPPPPPAVLTWREADTIILTLATEPAGEARTMKLTLIGRPGKTEIRGSAVLFRMQGKPPGPLPKGLPPVPTGPGMAWNVLVAVRQWNRVKESLHANQEDQLVVEGYPTVQNQQYVLLAQSCTSVLMQRAQKQTQQAQAEAKG